MKKLNKIAAASIIAASFFSSSAFAKTEGSYLGLDVLSSRASHKYSDGNSLTSSYYGTFKDNAIGYGVNYKYAFNYGNFFVAPGLFVEKIGTKSIDRDHDPVTIDNRYGAKIDFGYDITENFAAYLTAGIANVSYKVDWKSINKKNSDTQVAGLAGAGLLFHPHKNVTLSVEYNFQSLDLDAPKASNGNITKVKTDINTAKIGVAYHF